MKGLVAVGRGVDVGGGGVDVVDGGARVEVYGKVWIGVHVMGAHAASEAHQIDALFLDAGVGGEGVGVAVQVSSGGDEIGGDEGGGIVEREERCAGLEGVRAGLLVMMIYYSQLISSALLWDMIWFKSLSHEYYYCARQRISTYLSLSLSIFLCLCVCLCIYIWGCSERKRDGGGKKMMGSLKGRKRE